MKKIVKIKNLDCAACAAELSEELNRLNGIKEAYADFINQRVSLQYDDEDALQRAMETISHFEEVEIVEPDKKQKDETHRKEILSIALSALFFVPGLTFSILSKQNSAEWLGLSSMSCFLVSFCAAGWLVAFRAGRNLLRAFKNGFHPSLILDENLLMLIASVAAAVIGEYMESASVMLLYQIGELLQSIAVGSSRGAIKSLMEMQSESAILLEEGQQRDVSPDSLNVGNLILIRKGDKIPVDCRLLEGDSALDVKSLTGEAYLREVSPGDEMLAGSINAGNAIKAEVVRPVQESAVQKILDLVENSSAKKAKPEKFISRFARIYTPVVVLLAVLIAVLPPLFDGYNFSKWLVPAIEFLVISCPCALIISVPLAYFSGVGRLAKYGVLTKGAVYLDELAKIQVAAFDKTGTLTEGKFSISKVNGERRALQLAAALEKQSSHPLAQAFERIECDLPVENVREISGHGLIAKIEGKTVLVGSYRLMQREKIPCDPLESSAAVIYVAEEGALIGSIEIEDSVRSESSAALSALKKCGIRKIAVLTGDTRSRAEGILKPLPVDEIYADLLPEQKPECAAKLKQYGNLMFVGDGINDTPVMAQSDVSFAMGALGSAAAIEASDFVLSNLSALPIALLGAKKTRRIVMQNIVLSIAIKIALMVVSLLGTATGAFVLPIWAAVLGDVGVMLLAVLNAMRMRSKLGKN